MRYNRYALRHPHPVCSLCGRRLGAGELYFSINGSVFCDDCLPDYARAEFLPFRHYCGEERFLDTV
ncbi:MAG: hypothetical protein RRY95_06150 [Oscillospiraceae bacterium]